jgi:hypothetical protein
MNEIYPPKKERECRHTASLSQAITPLCLMGAGLLSEKLYFSVLDQR